MTEQKRSRWGLRGKTFWNWLELLIVPAALVVIGFVFTVQQDARQQEIENRRAEAERELAEQRAQDEALQAYLDQMSTLLLEKNLRASEEESEVRTLARARTLTVLGRLDPTRKEAVMQFLVEGQLVQRIEGREPIISLSSIRIDNGGSSGVMFDERRTVGSGVDLSGVDLSNANLTGAELLAADLSEANLTNADLTDAELFLARLSGANLISGDLSDANLYAARLSNADLSSADLSGADLSSADLSGADLSYADLGGAEGITNEELEQQVEFLVGATMPNGQKYEEWLRDRKASGDE